MPRGRVVKLKEWEDMEKEFGLDRWGNIKINRDTRIYTDMRFLCGTYEVIFKDTMNMDGHFRYRCYYIPKEMIEKVVKGSLYPNHWKIVY